MPDPSLPPSPYSPGATPAVLAGRREQVESARADLAVVATYARFVGRVRVDIGPRGVGKTSLLKTVRDAAAEAGLVTAWVTARADEGLVASLVHAVGEGLAAIGVDVSRHRGLRDRLRRLTLEVGAGPAKAGVELDVSPQRGPGAGAASAELGGFVTEASLAARDRGSAGLCLLVDEIQAAPVADLRTIAYAWQELQDQQPQPAAVLFAAGLPNTPDVLTSAVTFSERFAFRTLQRLDDADATEALVRPAASYDVTWEPDLLGEVVALTQGYPYFLQLYGDALWRTAAPEEGGRLTRAHLAAAETTIATELETMFRARWAKASPGERRFLAAMAESVAQTGQEPVRRADLAERLGVSSNDLSVPRRSLLDKGLVEVVGRGTLAFTTPGFADFVREESAG
jgi:hypothetical protein